MRTYKEEHYNRILEHNKKNNLKYLWNALNKSIKNGEKKYWLCRVLH